MLGRSSSISDDACTASIAHAAGIARAVVAAQLGGEQHEHRAHTLGRCEQRVAHRVDDGRRYRPAARVGIRRHESLERAVDSVLVLVKNEGRDVIACYFPKTSKY